MQLATRIEKCTANFNLNLFIFNDFPVASFPLGDGKLIIKRNKKHHSKIRLMSTSTLLLIILIVLLLGALPTWPYSSGWGYYPSGGLGLVVLILVILLLLGKL
jgi:Protein of unknown function (DUF3309)